MRVAIVNDLIAFLPCNLSIYGLYGLWLDLMAFYSAHDLRRVLDGQPLVRRSSTAVGAIASVFPASAWQGRCAGFLTIEAYIFMKWVEIVGLALICQYCIPRLREVLWVDDCDAIFKRITILQSKVLG